jgi:hypothetical protein
VTKYTFFTASQVNKQSKTEAKAWHQNRKFRLWIGLALLIVLAVVASSLVAYFLTGNNSCKSN